MKYLPLLLLFLTSCRVTLEVVEPVFIANMEKNGYTNVQIYNRVKFGCTREMHAFEWTAIIKGKNYRGRSCCKTTKDIGCSKSYEIREN